MYLALYRKFRPTNFEQVVGQQHIVTTLKNQIQNQQIGHAYLFCGSRGTGKTSVAKIFAKAVNCLSPYNGSPCGDCEVCKNLSQTSNIDVIEIDAASNNRVDEIRDLRDKVKYPPIYGKYKVYIIDEVHMLTDSAFNALLKTLEEPPKHIIFILATTEPQKLPATILSRVLRFDFKLVGQNDLENLIKDVFFKSNIKAEKEAITQIAKAGNGSVRDALSIADMCASFSNNNIKYQDVLSVLGTSTQEVLSALSEAVLRSDIIRFMTILNEQLKEGKNIITICSDLTKYLRDLLIIKTSGVNKILVDIPEKEQKKLKESLQNFSVDRISNAFVKFSEIGLDIKYSTNPVLMVETIAIELAENMQEGISQENLTPHKIWGQVLAKLSEEDKMLHAACVNISNVSFYENDFKINVDNKSVLEMLKKDENHTKLVACFKKLGYNYNVLISFLDEDDNVDKAKILSQKLGLSVNIKNKK